MTPVINIKQEVETLLGRKMTPAEECHFWDLRNVGYANPIDIVAMMLEE